MPPEIVSRETSDRLNLYEAEIRRWNPRINLVSAQSLRDFRQRHLADALQLLPLLPAEGTIADLGSGAGLPGLVVAIAGHRPVTLVEADQRKAAFLASVAGLLGAPVTVIPRRIEASGLHDVDVVLARALAPLPRLFELIAPILSRSGRALLPKGASHPRELTDAEAEWQMDVRRHPSLTAPDACILEVTHLRRRTASASAIDHRDREPERRRR